MMLFTALFKALGSKIDPRQAHSKDEQEQFKHNGLPMTARRVRHSTFRIPVRCSIISSSCAHEIQRQFK